MPEVVVNTFDGAYHQGEIKSTFLENSIII